jgi:hypothetical protein
MLGLRGRGQDKRWILGGESGAGGCLPGIYMQSAAPLCGLHIAFIEPQQMHSSEMAGRMPSYGYATFVMEERVF